MGTKSLDKALGLFLETLSSSDGLTTQQLLERSDEASATVYRQVASLVKNGLLTREKGGRLVPGAMLLSNLDRHRYHNRVSSVARPHLKALSKQLGHISQMGVLQDDMVTYLVKVEAGGRTLFTEETKQLEAYCSGIGKVLLAELPPDALTAYLDTAPFPRLTQNTICTPNTLRSELSRVRSRGFATDHAEIHDDLYCVAVPIHDPQGCVQAAISVSRLIPHAPPDDTSELAAILQATADRIERALYGHGR